MVNKYFTAQVCLQGDSITRNVEHDGSINFCPKCGKETIIKCDSCDSPLRGDLQGVMPSYANIPPDPYCYDCGEPYPWTRSVLEASRKLADEFEELDEKDKDILIESIPDLLVKTPNSEISIVRYKRILKKVGKSAYDAFYRLLVDVLSETAKKTLTNS